MISIAIPGKWPLHWSFSPSYISSTSLGLVLRVKTWKVALFKVIFISLSFARAWSVLKGNIKWILNDSTVLVHVPQNKIFSIKKSLHSWTWIHETACNIIYHNIELDRAQNWALRNPLSSLLEGGDSCSVFSSYKTLVQKRFNPVVHVFTDINVN